MLKLTINVLDIHLNKHIFTELVPCIHPNFSGGFFFLLIFLTISPEKGNYTAKNNILSTGLFLYTQLACMHMEISLLSRSLIYPISLPFKHGIVFPHI